MSTLTSTAFGATLRVPRPSSTPFYMWAPLETGDSGAAGGGERSSEAERRWAGHRANATEAEKMMLGLARTAHSGRCRSNYGHRFGAMRGQRLKVSGSGIVQTIDDGAIPEDLFCPSFIEADMTPIITPVCASLLFNFRASCRPSPLASPPPRHRRCRRRRCPRVAFHRFCYNFRMGRGRGRRSTLSRART